MRRCGPGSRLMPHAAPKIYHLHPLVAGPLRGWAREFQRISALGFNWVCLAPPFVPGESGDISLPADLEALHPALAWDGSADSGLEYAASEATRFNLRIMLDVRLDQVAQDDADFFLHRAAVAGGSQPQIGFDGVVELSNGQAGHGVDPLGGLDLNG